MKLQWLWLGILLSATAQGQTRDSTGSVVLVVTIAETRQPVAYADVRVDRVGLKAFANGNGVLTMRGLPASPVDIVVRRMGFKPVTARAVVRADATDTVRVALSPLAIELAQVRVTGALCPGDPRADTAVVAILEQVLINAQRSRLLGEEYPYESTLERIIGNGGRDELYSRRTGARSWVREILRTDTIFFTSNNGWRYAPGKLIVPNDKPLKGVPNVREKMIIPQLADFGDDAFLAAHCFRYAGVEQYDGRSVFRVDFQPTRDVRTPDVNGSLYFSTDKYQIVRSTLYAERPTTPMALGTRVRVDTFFMEFLPGMPFIEYVAVHTTNTGAVTGRDRDNIATEAQTLLSFEFLGRRPGEEPPR